MRLFIALLLVSTTAFGAWERAAVDQHFATGYRPSLSGAPDGEHVAPFVPAQLPAAYDVRNVVRIPDVKNQGSCGSCWAFASTAVFEIGLRLKGITTDLLSEQELVSCDKDFSGCYGGDAAHAYQQSPGQSPAVEFPYKAANVRCKSALSHKYHIQRWGYVGGASSPTTDEIKASILEHGAVAVTVAADRNFMNYKAGVFDTCHGRNVNHLVTLIGWDDKDGAWIVRNSWGRPWGEAGYGRVKYGCNRIGGQATFVEVE